MARLQQELMRNTGRLAREFFSFTYYFWSLLLLAIAREFFFMHTLLLVIALRNLLSYIFLYFRGAQSSYNGFPFESVEAGGPQGSGG